MIQTDIVLQGEDQKWSDLRYSVDLQKDVKTTLETSGEDVKTTLETSGEDVKTTLETSGKDVKTTLETSGKLEVDKFKHKPITTKFLKNWLLKKFPNIELPKFVNLNGMAKTTLKTSGEDVQIHSKRVEKIP
jgi:hypothetical protein